MTDRLARLRAAMAERSLPAFLVTTPPGVRWLSGFTSPEDARVLVTPDDAWLLTDGRYTAQAAEESSIEPVIDRDWMDQLAARLPHGTVAVEAEHLTLAAAAKLAGKLGHEPIRTDDMVGRLRRVKDANELDAIRRAARLTDRAYEHALTQVRPGVREIDVALEIERFVRTNGGDGMAFDIIVASGHRSAMPHGLASTKEIADGELVTLDMGARWQGYCADMTRTIGVGSVSDAHRSMFDDVLAAEEAALAQVGPDAVARDLDAVARGVLGERGRADAFVHSLGHGVGLVVHEGPGLSARSDDVLAAGMVVTIEPGVYYPGDAGVRVEDLVVVTDDGHDVLSSAPKGWRSVDGSSA